MTKIAFFGDEAAAICARLVSNGLATLNSRTILALPPEALGPDDAAAPERVAVVDLDRCLIAPGLGQVGGREAHRNGIDVVAALPLERVADGVLRSMFDVVITVGAGPVAGALALRAARYEAARAPDAAKPNHAPAWFLARSDQSILMTKARLSSVHGPRLPFATRALPMLLPKLTAREVHGLRSWEPEDPVLAAATLLAALVLAIAADPTVSRIEATDLAAMMAAGGQPGERRLADRLRALARSYGRMSDGIAMERAHRRGGRGSDRRHPTTRVGTAASDELRSPAPRVLRSYR